MIIENWACMLSFMQLMTDPAELWTHLIWSSITSALYAAQLNVCQISDAALVSEQWPHYISLRCCTSLNKTKKKKHLLQKEFRINEYISRRKWKIHVPICNTSLFKRCVINMGIRLYNKMTTKITQVESFTDHIQKFKLFLLDNIFYSLKVFCMFEEDNGTNN
jgi:hypothetical protein